MILTLEEKQDFIKKAAFIADKSTCGYKIGCVGVTEVTSDFELPTDVRNNPHIKIMQRKVGPGKLLYIKTWNETLPGEIYCQERDSKGNKKCIRIEQNLKGKDVQKVCSIHAEAKLIATCAKYGIPTNGMAMFITNTPCYICAKSIYVAGFSEVNYISEHTDKTGLEFLEGNDIFTKQLH